jgi:hypothetical protein
VKVHVEQRGVLVEFLLILFPDPDHLAEDIHVEALSLSFGHSLAQLQLSHKVVRVEGIDGVGKTTLARKLAEPMPGAHLAGAECFRHALPEWKTFTEPFASSLSRKV